MPRSYTVTGPNASSSANKTMAAINNTANVRCKVVDVLLGSQATPAEQAAMYSVGRYVTTLGTSTSQTPAPVDPLDSAAVGVGAITHSVEPTTYLVLLNIPLNQRASFLYRANAGAEFSSTATATSGVGVFLSAATTAMVEWATLVYFE